MACYSHSRLSTFEQCKYRYKLQYIDEVEVEEQDSVEAFLGSRSHDALEKLYTDLKFQKLLSLKELLKHFNDLWKKNWHKNVKIFKEGYTEENYRKMGEKFLTDYYKRYHPFDDGVTIATEKRIVINLNKTYRLQGYIDRLVSKGSCYEIHDYKTSSYLPTQDEADKDRQLALYALAVKESYKDAVKLKLIWHYLAFDKEIISNRTDKQFKQLRKEVIQLIKEIESTKDFSPNVSKLCDWCEYKNICPKWSHLAKIEAKSVKEFKKDEGVILVDKFAAIKQEIHDKDAELDKVKEDVADYCRQFGISVVFGSDNKVSWTCADSVKFPGKGTKERERLVRFLKDIGKYNQVTDIDTSALRRIMQEESWDKANLKKLKGFASVEKTERLSLSKLSKND